MSRLGRKLLSFYTLLVFMSATGKAADQPRTKRYSCGDEALDKVINNYIYDTADLNCEPNAWTAISRLPPVRIVVYDPLSNSFAFVAVCPNDAGKTTANLDYLDRRRLALPTQKIRLLILPYNPADGEIVIQTLDGNGIEFEEMASAGVPPAPTPKASGSESEKKDGDKGKDESAKAKEKLPQGTEKKTQDLLARLKRVLETANDQNLKKQLKIANEETKRYTAEIQNTEDTALKGESLSEGPRTGAGAPVAMLDKTDIAFQEFHDEANDLVNTIDKTHSDLDCVEKNIRIIPNKIALDMVAGHVLTMAQDPPLCAVVAEAITRSNHIRKQRYVSCLEMAAFEDDAAALQKDLRLLTSRLQGLEQFLREISDSVEQMAGATGVVAVNYPRNLKEEWEGSVEYYRTHIEDAEEFTSLIGASLDEARNRLQDLRIDYEDFTQIQNQRAETFQRKNYKPLQNGQSITLNVQRRLPDSHLSDPIAQLEIRSAPAYNVRFGMGIIASNLENRTFKAGPENPATKEKRILSEDENQILPIVAVHHYWGKRSPLLGATLFERLMPTFSLGIPIAQSNVLEQALFGLNWDLAPGIEMNVGLHVGRIQDLDRGYEAGQSVASTLDITTIQRKKMDTAVYFGIVLNRDSFTSLFNGQKKESGGS